MLNFEDSDIEILIEKYENSHNIPENRKLYFDCIMDYISNGSVKANKKETLTESQEDIYSLFENNIILMEQELEKSYKQAQDYILPQEEIDKIYTIGEKLMFSQDVMLGIIHSYEKKSGILKFREEEERKKILASMTRFELYGKEIAFTKEQCVGIVLGKEYRKNYYEIESSFLDMYNQDCKKEDYWDNLNKRVITLIDIVYKSMIKGLEDRDVPEEIILNIDYMGVFKEYWIPLFDKIDYQYNVICLGKEGAEYYRQFRKENRGRFVGGGFGLEGALKGIATAGALNLATGVAHSAFNFVGNIKDELKRSHQLRNLFGDELKEEILKMFMKTVEKIYHIELRIWEEQGLKNKGFKLFYEEIKLNDFYYKMLQERPFDKRLYEKALKKFGDENQELEQLGEFTGIDVLKLKEQSLNDKFSNAEVDEDNGEAVLLAIQKMKTKLGYQGKAKAEIDIRKRIDELKEEKVSVYDLETVGSFSSGCIRKPPLKDGKKRVYKNEQELKKKKELREEFISVYNGIDYKNISSIDDAFNKLKANNKESQIGESIIKDLDQYLKSKLKITSISVNKDWRLEWSSDKDVQLESVQQYEESLQRREEIKEIWNESFSLERKYEVYMQMKRNLGELKWEYKFVESMYNNLEWEKLFSSMPSIMEEDFVYLEQDGGLEVPELCPIQRDGTWVLDEGKSFPVSDKNLAYEIRKNNEAVKIIWSTIKFYDEDDIRFKLEKMYMYRSKNALYEKVTHTLSEILSDVENTNNIKYGTTANGESYRKEKQILDQIERIDWRARGYGNVINTLWDGKKVLELKEARKENLTSTYSQNWMKKRTDSVVSSYKSAKERSERTSSVFKSFMFFVIFVIALFFGIALFFASAIIGKILAIALVWWRWRKWRDEAENNEYERRWQQNKKRECEIWDSLIEVRNDKIYFKND